MNLWNLTMKTTRTTNDPIVAEVRAARDKHAAQFGYNIKDIFKNNSTRHEKMQKRLHKR